MKKIIVTGSSGLIGSEVCRYFAKTGHQIHGLDNNQRAIFSGNHHAIGVKRTNGDNCKGAL